MSALLVGVGLVLAAAAPSPRAAAASGERSACLSTGALYAETSAHTVLEPEAAIAAARGALPGADVLRAALCRGQEGLVYEVTLLGADGRLLRVTVDGVSGKIKTAH